MERFDCICIGIEDSVVRWVHETSSLGNADAAMKMAIARQGLGDQFFACVPAGKYSEGEKFTGGAVHYEPEKSGGHIKVGDTWYPDGPRGLPQ